MFCPKCRYEYQPHVTECPDCEEKLVAVLPEVSDDESEDESAQANWVSLARLTSFPSAHMIIEVLRDKDIPAIALDSSGYFGQTGQMGATSYRPIEGAYYTITVPEEFLAEADAEAEAVLGEEWVKSRLIDIE